MIWVCAQASVHITMLHSQLHSALARVFLCAHQIENKATLARALNNGLPVSVLAFKLNVTVSVDNHIDFYLILAYYGPVLARKEVSVPSVILTILCAPLPSFTIWLSADRSRAFLVVTEKYNPVEHRDARNWLFVVGNDWAMEVAGLLHALPALKAIAPNEACSQPEFVHPDTGEVYHPWIEITFRKRRRRG